MTDPRPIYGTAWGRSLDKKNLRLTCFDCEGEEVLLPLDIQWPEFKVEQKKFSEAHRPCRGGKDEPCFDREDK